ncbi:GH36-type glycosyl hydrolase domain-containing protein [Aquabacterium sp.]|uniref:GH36-type glycosyl hydrolase domain-containing protein n=1 Tax=Aquabacterium sp. TaxID=1872578 RepID=UPI002E3020A5|nr:glucoamylase family protein [Aquabacterium sp.]HEX5311970.1 glucoamylase family protein [Aquabacterium sp.]
MAGPDLQQLIAQAPKALCSILDGKRGPLEAPIRSEIFGPQRFAQHGRSLGESHRAAKATWRTANFFPRLDSNIRTLREAQHYIGEQAITGYDISPAAEWLLDNFHLIEAQLKEIHEGLPRRYFRTLPILVDPPLAGLPRVYGVAWAFVAHTDGAFDADLLTRFLMAYEESRELSLSEMWALPTTLRVVLIENLRRLAERVATHKAAREAANLCCDRIENYTLHALDELLALINQRGAGAVFLTQMALRLQDRHTMGKGGHHARYQAWLHNVMPDLAAAQAQQNADQAADNLSVSNAVTSLRAIGDADWTDIVAESSTLMRLMLTSDIFKAEQVKTRDQTLHDIETLARSSGLSEVSVASTLLNLMHADTEASASTASASHWLKGKGRPDLIRALGMQETGAMVWRFCKRYGTLPAYLIAMLSGTLAVVAWLLYVHPGARRVSEVPLWLTLLGIVLMSVPASEAAVAVINRLISESVRPRYLPRLAMASGIPSDHRVMVVIPALLSNVPTVHALVHRLHLHYLANPEPHAQFALLTDWVDADTVRIDTDQALLNEVRQAIGDLNARCPPTLLPDGSGPGSPRFIVLHRERLFSESEQRWIGWERKRGKLELLIDALAQGASKEFLNLGQASMVAPDIKYVVTLDSDTQLPPGRLRELVSIAAHPHNQPVLDPKRQRVLAGYAILQPRTVAPLSARRDFTIYHWLFAGQAGVDPYSASSSEIYQDLFDEGSFNGKGLLHVQAMHAVLSGRLPEGRVLSHDLLEGAMARCAAVTDVTVIEDAPFHADVAASRFHRWTRGDWQLLPFMLQPRRYRLRAINLWKMCDNLRRSLVAPASLALMTLSLAGWIVSPWAAVGLILAAYSAGPLMGAIAGLWPSHYDVARFHFYRQALVELTRAVAGGCWHLALLMSQAWLAVDAIVRALFRLAFSHRHLLQWTPAESARSMARVDLPTIIRSHWVESAWSILLLSGLWLSAMPRHSGLLSWALCPIWAATPIWIWWGSRPRFERKSAEPEQEDSTYLRGIARDTWRYFERCVGPGDHHLPPDNLQTAPHDMVAHRTSPTNIGLYLLSVACARQFGWIGTQDLLTRLEATLTSMRTLERHRGHFLNWYDTRTCSALLPKYLSTVDSGNLCGHLLTVAQACRELAKHPYQKEPFQRALKDIMQRMAPLIAQRLQLTQAQRDELRWLLADHRATKRSAQRDAEASQALTDAASHAFTVTRRLRYIAHEFEQLADQADFGFLYHPKRHLFHLGFRVGEQQLDAGFYDLLASEARLTGLWAIAKGDVPVSHWSTLGRPFYALGHKVGVRSWSGSMFEYLMPGLILEEPSGSVLSDACDVAVQEQKTFSRLKGVPWGISESAYAQRDHTLAYQYAPHGVPRLALRRTPHDELVIAPYATALAAQLDRQGATLNFQDMQRSGARARYGFVEAIDYTPGMQIGGETSTPVYTFMAHHQGMVIVSLANVLLEKVVQRWGMANVHIEAVSSLLHERPPREVSNLYTPLSGPTIQSVQPASPGLLRKVIPGTSAIEPTHLLSNGRYQVTLRANGAGWSRWGQIDITRWRDDALRDAYGSFLYVRRSPAHAPMSLSQHPAPDPEARYQSTFHADRVCLEARWAHWQALTTVWVSPEDDIEFRQVEMHNQGDKAMEIELISAFEVALSPAQADEAHPAFANLFVRAKWLADHRALVLERQPRLHGERVMMAAHFVAETDAEVLTVTAMTDRLHWAGRNQHASQPTARFGGTPTHAPPLDGQPCDTGLDPVSALCVRLKIPAHSKAMVTFATAASDHAPTLHAIIDKYRQPSHVQRASMMSATLTSIRLHALRVSHEHFSAIQTLSTALLLTLTRPHAQPSPYEPSEPVICNRRLLWRLGISGDRPIILVSASLMQGLTLLRNLAQALRLWSWGGVACDLVVVDAEASSYYMALHHELMALRDRYGADMGAAPESPRPAHSGYHVLLDHDLTHAERQTLQHLAAIHIHADGRPLQVHVAEWVSLHQQAMANRTATSTQIVPVANTRPGIVMQPLGAFSDENGSFSFAVGSLLRPQRPWINVLSNPVFGMQLSEAGGGYTWAVNSRSMQLTAWSNDPISDPPSEIFLIQDTETRETWSLTPSCWGQTRSHYQVTHGQGFSVISHRLRDLEIRTTWSVDCEAAIKQVQVQLVNHGTQSLRLRLIGLVEWMMGARRSDRSTVHTDALHHGSAPHKLTALLATQEDRVNGFGGATGFLAMTSTHDDKEDWTCDRRELFDPRGRLVLPDRLGRHRGAGLDPCAALGTSLSLAGGASAERVFLMGYAQSPALASDLLNLEAWIPTELRLRQVMGRWNRLLDSVTVKTPDPLLDVLVNRWLLYQTVACRLWAKAGFYQAGGATGFRDQLQDTLSLSWAQPNLLRQQILLCASRQFAEGDVQHWWHAPDGAGVRTHFSDDLLWLPFACSHYVRTSGDTAVLDQLVPFLEGPGIPEGAEDAYYAPTISSTQATVYEHAARTIDRSLRVGVHGLPLMGTGDWNDGMNRVGHGGRGESVWLGWFLCRIVADFVPLAVARGELERAQRWQHSAQEWQAALNDTAWDGEWFKRAYFDDGQPLGSQVNAEAQIDLIAQAWSVLSKAGAPDLQRAAMAAVDQHLVNRAAGLIQLLTPPLADALPSAGYIQAYPPGVRENGGQYSHAGVWALMAQAQLAQHTPSSRTDESTGDMVYRYFTYLSPAHRAAHPEYGAAYGIEPYVMAGDVYTQPPYVGRGGWSWYTGSASWMHRAVVESMFGLQQSAVELSFTPCLPSTWSRAELTLRRHGRTMHFIFVTNKDLTELTETEPEWVAGGAMALAPGQAFQWVDLPPQVTVVIQLSRTDTPEGVDPSAVQQPVTAG